MQEHLTKSAAEGLKARPRAPANTSFRSRCAWLGEPTPGAGPQCRASMDSPPDGPTLGARSPTRPRRALAPLRRSIGALPRTSGPLDRARGANSGFGGDAGEERRAASTSRREPPSAPARRWKRRARSARSLPTLSDPPGSSTLKSPPRPCPPPPRPCPQSGRLRRPSRPPPWRSPCGRGRGAARARACRSA